MTYPVPVALPVSAPLPVIDMALIDRLVGDLFAVQYAADTHRPDRGELDGVVALADLLHTARVALINPGSRQAVALIRALGRFDGLRQAVVPDPGLDAAPASGRPCNRALVHSPAHCELPGCTGGRRVA